MSKKKALGFCTLVSVLLVGTAIVLPLRIRAKARRDWKNAAVAELERLSSDASWLSQQLAAVRKQTKDGQSPEGSGFNDYVILMRNGEWIVYKNICSKEDWRIDDLFIGKASNGQWYYSTFHFCIKLESLRALGNPSADLSAFIQDYFLREFDGRSDEALQKTWPPG